MSPDQTDVPTPARTGATRRGLFTVVGPIVLILLWMTLQLWGLGREPFHTHGEAREALVVQQMTHHGGWILPLRDGPTGVEVPSKPPLFHWMGALISLRHRATDEWSIRLPSAGLSLAGDLVVYAAGTALWGPTAGFIGATTVLTSFEWNRAATAARVDMTLTFGLLIAFLALLFFMRSGSSRWLVPFYAGMAFAALAKGPIGVVLPGAQLVIMCALERDLATVRRMRLVRGLIAVAVVVGAWYVLALLTGGVAFFAKQILNENIYRFAEANEYEGGHRHGALYLLGGLAAGWLPWTLFVPGVIVALWQRRRELAATDPRVYLLSWIVVVFGFYAVAVSKRSVYLLGLYPALGLLVGWWWSTLIEHQDGGDPRWLRATLRPIAVLAAAVTALLLLVVIVEIARPGAAEALITRVKGTPPDVLLNARWVAAGLRRFGTVSVILLAAGSAALWSLSRTLGAGRWTGAFGSTLVAFAAIGSVVKQIVMPEIARRETYRDSMPAIRRVVGESVGLFFYRAFDYGAVFYWGDHIVVYSGDLSIDAPRYLLVPRNEWNAVEAAQGERFESVTVPGLDTDDDPRRLLLVKRRDG
ncbi:MAG TPA: glycosyltransferase family 39 protein [Candidatus Binatia bacterium]|nr:glycosyltransferase family 39 protein [Candidatus Binatia bacterium]